jgi:hypothetical protein
MLEKLELNSTTCRFFTSRTTQRAEINGILVQSTIISNYSNDEFRTTMLTI